VGRASVGGRALTRRRIPLHTRAARPGFDLNQDCGKALCANLTGFFRPLENPIMRGKSRLRAQSRDRTRSGGQHSPAQLGWRCMQLQKVMGHEKRPRLERCAENIFLAMRK
jgi:hypothetical protein